MKWFGKAPALYMTALITVVQLVAVLAHLSSGVQNSLTVIITAVFGLVATLTTRPIVLSGLTGFVTTVAQAVVVLGVHIRPDVISGINAVVLALATLLLTNVVSPSDQLGGPLNLRPRQAERAGTYSHRH